MIITKKIVFNEQGDPTDVLIPYEQFVELSETYGFDLDEQEIKELGEALADAKAGNHHAFVPASEI